MSDIFNIPYSVRLAIHAMMLIASESGKRLTIKTIADRTGCSSAHMAKVLAHLERNGLIKSKTGPTGGYKLSRSPDRINLLSIYKVMEGEIEMNKCPLAVPVCIADNGKCMGKFWKDLLARVISILKETTLRDIKVAKVDN